ncbi:MAG: glycosyltransferase family 4 protein, partial [Anaerolineae bacterium]|nr:glycosyltransferase family 4 protein [Anaerolineae bacterium]
GIELFVVENALTIPMNIPLGLAITEVIAETGMPTIAHHHDFYWERQRYLVNCVTDYLKACFPPTLPSIQHVVISSWAARQLSLNAGVSATVIPNVMDFDHPPETPDGYLAPMRADLGLSEDELLILQPTRVVQRKGIEHAIELVKRLGRPAHLVISHASGDEGGEYEQHVREFARLLDVPATFVSGIISTGRGTTPDGRRIYTLADVYAKADLVTYPSTIEGFGNAFLEAIYYRRPLVVNNYSIYAIDIKPKGFQVIEFDGFVSQRTIDETCKVLDNPPLVERMVEQNYVLGRKHYSHTVLAHQLSALLSRF